MPVGEFDYAKMLVPVYLSLYEQSQAMLKRFNPCNVCDGVCERSRRGQGKNFCCDGCVYLGVNGCQVKALQCSLWVCRYDLIHENNRRAFNNAMWGIMIDATEFHLLVPRGSMEDSIAQACQYYIEHRDERAALEKMAKNYKPRPCFFPPADKPKGVVGVLRSWGSAVAAKASAPKPAITEEVLASEMVKEEIAVAKEREYLKPAPAKELPEGWAGYVEEVHPTPTKEEARLIKQIEEHDAYSAVMKEAFFQWPSE